MESELEPLSGQGFEETPPVSPAQPRRPFWSIKNILIVGLFSGILISLIVVQVYNNQRFQQLETRIIGLQYQLSTIQNDNSLKFQLLEQKLQALRDAETEEHAKTSTEITSLQYEVLAQNASTSSEFEHVWDKVSHHDKQIIRLANHTSNADVIDELNKTKTTLTTQLEETKQTVDEKLSQTRQNVSMKLLQNKHDLVILEKNINSQLNNTLVRMKGVVDSASSHIYEVKQNVSNQLSAMSQNVQVTVMQLSHTVEDAENAITKQVVDVKDMIEQYKTVTNNKFAAENNFVKKQLAGTFVLLSCLIFLVHLTSHMRHYYQPVIQRKIMAVSCMVPVYSVTSWLSLVFPQFEPYFSSIRDCFEAYVVYTFLAFLVAILSCGLSLSDLLKKLAQYVTHDREALEVYDRQKAKAKAKAKAVKAGGGKGTPNSKVSGDDGKKGPINSSNGSGGYYSVPNTPTQLLQLQQLPSSDHMNNEQLQHAQSPQGEMEAAEVQEQAQGEEEDALDSPHERIKPPCPCGWSATSPHSVAKAWLYQCQLLVMQFVFVKPMLTVIPSLLAITKLYDVSEIPILTTEQTINYYSPNLYIILAQNISVALAFYGLLNFYHGVEEELAWASPWPKFLCIKIVVFATFWQNVCIQGMSAIGWVDESGALYIQNLLICIEMLIASLAHVYIFPYKEWHPDFQRGSQPKNLMLRDIMAFGDFIQDLRMMVTPWHVQQTAGSNQPITGSEAGGTAGFEGMYTKDEKTMSVETMPLNSMSHSSQIQAGNGNNSAYDGQYYAPYQQSDPYSPISPTTMIFPNAIPMSTPTYQTILPSHHHSSNNNSNAHLMNMNNTGHQTPPQQQHEQDQQQPIVASPDAKEYDSIIEYHSLYQLP